MGVAEKAEACAQRGRDVRDRAERLQAELAGLTRQVCARVCVCVCICVCVCVEHKTNGTKPPNTRVCRRGAGNEERASAGGEGRQGTGAHGQAERPHATPCPRIRLRLFTTPPLKVLT